MSDDGPLIVPISVQAVVVNDPAVNFVRAAMNYGNLAQFQPPNPGPFQQDDSNFASEQTNQGAYVMWSLPQALRQGTQIPGSGTSFPLVPNRWLVTRLYRAQNSQPTALPQAAAWVVVSDAIGTTAGSAYLDPTQPGVSPTRIGECVAITAQSPWTEPNPNGTSFLTAVAEGNPAFAAYQPFNQNVFSFFDDLETQQLGAGTLSYLVVGWYAQSGADPLASWPALTAPPPSLSAAAAFAQTLASLQWSASAAGTTTVMSLYEGFVFGLSWQPGGPAPVSAASTITPQVAIANTSSDGVVAFAYDAVSTATTPPDGLSPSQAAELLQAFQYNALELIADPNGAAILDQMIRARWFGATPSETTWDILDAPVPADAPPPVALSAAEIAKEATWLATLNAQQAAYDEATRNLAIAQRQLLELWWKQAVATALYNQTAKLPWGISALDDFTAPLAALNETAAALLDQLAALTPTIPLASAAVSYDEAVQAYAQAQGLPATRVLKSVAAPPFRHAQDPVIVIANTNKTGALNAVSTLLPTRWPTEIATGLSLNAGGGVTFNVTSAQLATLLPDLTWTDLPALVPTLFAEFVLLDPTNVALLAEAADQSLNAGQLAAAALSMTPPQVTQGSAPAECPAPWVQAWQPLYLDWEIYWYAIPFESGGRANWEFNGLDYDFVPGLTPPIAQTIQGRSILTPKPSFEFQARLGQFIADNPESPATAALQALEDLVQSVDQWDFLSQTFTGLAAQLGQESPMVFQLPDNTTPVVRNYTQSALIGLAGDNPPQSLLMNPLPHGGGPPPSTFEGIRAGQFQIARLSIVDAFGQTIEIVTSETMGNYQPPPLFDPAVTPQSTIVPQDAAYFAQLPPRLLQPARLDFAFANGSSGNPLLGWVLPNHLDLGLSVYGADGSAYGELTPAFDSTGSPIVAWTAAPGSPYMTTADLATAQPDLGGFASALQNAGPTAFSWFLQSIDETLWDIDPLGQRSDAFLSTMLGRPLAVVAASLAFELQYDALTDVSWPYTFNAPAPLFLGYTFPVQLGAPTYAQDGLLGYFVGGNYTIFNAVHLAQGTTTSYLASIGSGNWIELSFAASGSGPVVPLTLLVDPRAPVHAFSGILPMVELSLPPQTVDAALAKMQALFRTGPILATLTSVVSAVGAGDSVAAYAIPQPAEKTGAWSWVERGASGAFTPTQLAPIDATAQFLPEPPTLREGYLALNGGLGSAQETMK